MKPRSVRRSTGPLLVAFVLSSLAGCGGGAAEAVVPVEGQVKIGDKLLTKGSVTFFPDTTKGNTTKHEPRGTIDADGKYKITTHPRDGAPPGWYKVAVQSTESSDPKNPYAMPKHLIPEKFGKAETSKLMIEVRKDAPAGAYDLELK